MDPDPEPYRKCLKAVKKKLVADDSPVRWDFVVSNKRSRQKSSMKGFEA